MFLILKRNRGHKMKNDELKLGIIYTASTYILWGFLPIFWKQLDHVGPGQILAHRIVWSFVFMLFVLTFSRNWHGFLKECKKLLKEKKKLVGIILASALISANWLIFIWAVNTDHIIQVSLGYYINPLVSILLGVIVLKEKLSFWQVTAFALAAIGVLYMTIQFGVFPWVSILLAMSFGLYGLLKKVVTLKAMYGFTIETLIVTPIALLFLIQSNIGQLSSLEILSNTSVLLIISGVVTAVPLLLFAAGASRIPLSMVGFLQYFAPTLMLILGVLLYHEPFTNVHLVAFAFIWTACAVYSLSRTKLFLQLEAKILPKKKAA
jgi:chloramphenicol-sensitive protein RarD